MQVPSGGSQVGQGGNPTATHSLKGFGLQRKVLIAKLLRKIIEENQIFISRVVFLILWQQSAIKGPPLTREFACLLSNSHLTSNRDIFGNSISIRYILGLYLIKNSAVGTWSIATSWNMTLACFSFSSTGLGTQSLPHAKALPTHQDPLVPPNLTSKSPD